MLAEALHFVPSPVRMLGMWPKIALATLGAMLGAWHVKLALVSLFLFRQAEPASSWVVIGALFATLPLSLVSPWAARVAAALLWCAASSALVTMLVSSPWEQTLASLVKLSGPQAVLGTALWIAARRVRRLGGSGASSGGA